jgi:type IV pilus assembly protein PilB
MGERRTLGQILMSFGRVTEADVARALEHQRENGGYFGEALQALGYVTPEELEWALAAQFDIPYVFPEAENIDPEAAALVTPEWALAHLTLPIMKTPDTLSVIVDSPIKTEAVDQLQAKTDRRIELALAPPDKIRELIRNVYGYEEGAEDSRKSVATLADVFSSALEARAPRFGVSVRGAWAHAWFVDDGIMHRVALDGNWPAQLAERVSPRPADQIADKSRADWQARLALEGVIVPVEVHYLGNVGGAEYVFEPVLERSRLFERFSPPASNVVSEIRMLARTGAAHFAVTSESGHVLDELLPYLPALLFESSWRSVHLVEEGRAVPDDVFAVSLPTQGNGQGPGLEELGGYCFDVATVDLPGPPTSWARAVRDVATVVFAKWTEVDPEKAVDVGIGWELRLTSSGEGGVEWTLRSLRV